MVINGIKIKKFQQLKKLNDAYFTAISQIVREALSELTFITIDSRYNSKSTDSIYFFFKMKHHHLPFVLSVRTHFPLETADNYFYFYLFEYGSPTELKKAIQKELIFHYELKTTTLAFPKKDPSAYIRTAHSCKNPVNKKKKKKKNVRDPIKESNDSFLALMNEINVKNVISN